MKVRERYKGFVLEVMSFALRDDPGFISDLFIEKHDGAGVTVDQFVMPGIYESDESAIQAAILAGRHKIDTGHRPTL